MKIRYGAVLVAAAAFLAGCAGFWDLPPSTTTTTTTTSTTDSSGYFYVLDETSKQIVGYYISSGTLEQISGTPISLPTPLSIAVAPGGGFLYVGTTSGIYLYTIESDGELSSTNTNISSDQAAAMQVSSSGPSSGSYWLIDAYSSSSSVTVNAYEISSTTGDVEETKGTQAYSVSNPSVNQMALSPDGDNLFLALGTAGTIVVPFTSGNSNPLASTATVIDVYASGLGSALSVAVAPGASSSNNELFYVGETDASGGNGGLRAFNYSSLGTGTPRTPPSEISNSPFATGYPSPNAILPEASGNYVYVANGDGDTQQGNIALFTVSPSTSGTGYTIAAASDTPLTAGFQPIGLAEDSSDQFILAVSDGGSNTVNNNGYGDPDLAAYTMSSGALSLTIEAATGTSEPAGAHAVVALPSQ